MEEEQSGAKLGDAGYGRKQAIASTSLTCIRIAISQARFNPCDAVGMQIMAFLHACARPCAASRTAHS